MIYNDATVGPARAGMIRRWQFIYLRRTGWPRTSGDDPHYHGIVQLPAELAPHERG